MISIHVSQNLLDVKLNDWTFRYPERNLTDFEQKDFAQSVLDLHNSGKTINLITRSGIIFWTLAQAIAEEKINRKDLIIREHTGRCEIHILNMREVQTGIPLITTEYLSTWLDWPMNISPRVLQGGEQAHSALAKYINRYGSDSHKHFY